MNNIKITDHQLFSLTANGAIGGAVIVIGATLAGIAKQDAWITALITPLFGIPVIWVYWYLGSQHPNMTFVEIIKRILGKWIGFIAAACFVFLCLQIAAHLPWYIGNFITIQVMPETPAYAINFLFVAAFMIALLYGIETIARASEMFIYFVSFLFFLAMILVLPNANIENLQPVLENGVIPILKGSVFLSSFITFPLITLMMIFPVNINDMQQAKKALFKGYLFAGLIIFITILMSILILGAVMTAKSQFPTYMLAKEINVGIVFSRLEFIITALWLFTQFIIGLLFFYAGVIGLSQLLGLKDYKKIVIPLSLIILVMTEVVFPDTVYQVNWVNTVWVPYIITYGLILPVLLLLVFLIKKLVLKVEIL
ncbi:GerAB/ArcD/ProY family transporter [Candidatus Contubernalis alkaliaceticus]|uniref:GerAB/ArcD/ProY family transporter n=1 Tax=Candidatus Contubernalis alkaliaceticus TaxID=338645 RepID=UPI001F4C2A84|nr:endospore germination permease [Candidatus Contubernalis alkalaceticus]UNC91987.1 endospore germination permease [Candidatus Contubernalis alkalaceticus]